MLCDFNNPNFYASAVLQRCGGDSGCSRVLAFDSVFPCRNVHRPEEDPAFHDQVDASANFERRLFHCFIGGRRRIHRRHHPRLEVVQALPDYVLIDALYFTPGMSDL